MNVGLRENLSASVLTHVLLSRAKYAICFVRIAPPPVTGGYQATPLIPHSARPTLIQEPMNSRDEWDLPDDEDDIARREEELDEEFPLGDGVADLSSEVSCPYCGESVEITLDPGSGSTQEYIEDCQVCCRPWNVTVTYHEDGSAEVFVDASDDT